MPRFRVMEAPTPADPPDAPMPTAMAVAPDVFLVLTETSPSLEVSHVPPDQPPTVESARMAWVLLFSTLTATAAPTPALPPPPPTESTPPKAAAAACAETSMEPFPVVESVPVNLMLSTSRTVAFTSRSSQLKFSAPETAEPLAEAATDTTREKMPLEGLKSASLGSTLCVPEPPTLTPVSPMPFSSVD